MPWEPGINDCVAENNTPETPAKCICYAPTEEQVPSPVNGVTYYTPCIDCGKWGYVSTIHTGGDNISCCSLSGSVYESP